MPTSWRDVPITQGPDGLYHAKVTVGHKDNGKLDRRHRSGRTVKEVQEKLRTLFKDLEAGRLAKPGRMPTVEEWFSTWLTDIAPFGRRALKPRSLSDYWSKCRNWIFPNLGGRRLDTLEPEDLDRLYAKMRKAGKAESHVLKVHAIISRGLGVAHARGRIGRNVAAIVEPPGTGKAKRVALTLDAARRVVTVAIGRRNGVRWLAGLSIGPRQGEALGLCWPALDLDAGTVTVEWQLQRLTWSHGCEDPHRCAATSGPRGTSRHRFTACRPARRGPNKGKCPKHPGVKGCPLPCPKDCTRHAAFCPNRTGGGLVLTRPKTWREDRPAPVIGLDPDVVAALRRHQVAQRAERKRAANAWRTMLHPDGGRADLVFTQVDGAPIDPRQDWEEWQGILAEAGIRAVGTHVTRHTAASLMIAEDVDLAVVKEVLRHESVRTTQGYVTVEAETTRLAVERVGDSLFRGGVTDLVTERRKRRSS